MDLTHCALTVLAVLIVGSAAAQPRSVEDMTPEDLAYAPLPFLAEAVKSGTLGSRDLVTLYRERISALDEAGPTLNSVLSLNPKASEEAAAHDAARGEDNGPLHGLPILVKDNIETADPVATTAGSLALVGNVTGRDAPLAAGLRRAGAIVLGKANLSEWANFRDQDSTSGWSALGGQVRNPHMLDRSPCGSSSGSGAAIAAGLAAGAVGTETNGSIICPAAMNGIVGFKPSVGLISQTGIVPISQTQDTAGPMTRTVRGAAMMLDAMASGPDMVTDFTGALSTDALKGLRIGILRFAEGRNAEVQARFAEALEVLRAQGAVLVDIEAFEEAEGLGEARYTVLKSEFKAGVEAYLAAAAPAVTVRTLADLIAFNKAHAEAELPLFGQSIFDEAQEAADLEDESYTEALAAALRGAREDGIDRLLSDYDVQILVSPSRPPAFAIDPILGDHYPGGTGAGGLAAVAGYPHLTVPMGAVGVLPVGLSFMGKGGDDALILAAGYAYEQATNHLLRPSFVKTAADIPHIGQAMAHPDRR